MKEAKSAEKRIYIPVWRLSLAPGSVGADWVSQAPVGIPEHRAQHQRGLLSLNMLTRDLSFFHTQYELFYYIKPTTRPRILSSKCSAFWIQTCTHLSLGHEEKRGVKV